MDFDLECENLTKRFGVLTAVDEVSFTVPEGSFFSILGPSGCGKTTLMRMIAGFESPDNGNIRIKGEPVVGLPPNRRNVKMVFQHLALFPMMNVGENIAYGLRCRGAARDEIRRRVGDVLERVGLPDAAGKEIHQLSGGQKQRIAIARCMVLDPDVLLLDEPLGALDLKLREHMKVELKLLQHQFGTTFVYITHDQSEALVMSDRVAVMRDGRFDQIDTPQALYHNPQSAFVAGFVGDSNRWNGRVTRVSGDELVLETAAGLVLTGRTAGDSALRAGDRADIYVRPEAITTTRAGGSSGGGNPSDGANSLDGIIDSLLFNGANSRILVRTADDRLIEAHLPLTGDNSDLGDGERVTLSWPSDYSRCFAPLEG
ncbi:MAG: ABC transporter ATP-binding protein [Gammaproteobacteria bacterium]|nr:ABC transporter ATP-binding protein [Gammaproteobacteria bacterium]